MISDSSKLKEGQLLKVDLEKVKDRIPQKLIQSLNKISIGNLLTQLFEVTNQFNMKTQPQLLLLQKTMVVIEGGRRYLNAFHDVAVTRVLQTAAGRIVFAQPKGD